VPAVSAERTPLEKELPEIPESTPVEATMPADGGVAGLLYMCKESAGSFHSSDLQGMHALCDGWALLGVTVRERRIPAVHGWPAGYDLKQDDAKAIDV
jgi:hypothetical protein